MSAHWYWNWGGHPKSLDLVAGRRLAFAAAESGVTVLLLREGADEMPSAAQTRWRSNGTLCWRGDDWGNPASDADLLAQPPRADRDTG